ncbi:MAG: efflux RND transporter periplasmic adaptor subunit [Bacteroidales bacterium]|jgi:HlyD family secretion protein|nr:efflux RND transporter periplasmic adaptor subunit [Bacteroidales bacterium]
MKKIFKTVLFILIGIIFIGTFVFLWNKSRPKTIAYEQTVPQLRTIEKKITITGSMSPRNEILLKPQISGIITEIFKEAGQQVKAGDVIAKVNVVPDISQLSSAESRLNMAVISLEQIKTDFDRTSRLYKSGVVSAEEFENMQTSFKKAEEEVKNAQESLDIIRSGMSSSMAQYSNTQIRSTVTGMILDIPVKVGNSVIQANNFNDGTTIAIIADMSDLIFAGKIDETEIGKVKEGNEVNIIIGAMQEEKIGAVLEYISPRGTLSNGATTFDIKAAVSSKSDVFIRAGYSANGEITVEKKDSVLSIPESVLEFEGDSVYVYVLKPGNASSDTYDKKAVKVGLSDGIYIEVLEGITAEDKLRGKTKPQEADKNK